MGSSFANIICANEGVARVTKRITEPSLAINVFHICLEQVVHEEVVSKNCQRHTRINEGFLAPPIVLQHQWDLSAIPRDMKILVVTCGVRVCSHATHTHHMFDLIAKSTEVCAEFEMMLEQWIQRCTVNSFYTIECCIPSFRICVVKLHEFMRSNLLQVVALSYIVHSTPHIKFATLCKSSNHFLTNTTCGRSDEDSSSAFMWLNDSSGFNLHFHPRKKKLASKERVCRFVSSAFEDSAQSVTNFPKVLFYVSSDASGDDDIL
mmetsp:Transcript_24229/g.38764  ORF Transcript_24229/g.38764 Transcript_24229/m.38764 type:complete len:263 (-) Transcript_24229:337-1125(-)